MRHFTITCIIFFFTLSPLAAQCLLTELTLESKTGESSLIIEAKVIGQTAFKANNQHIYTAHTLEVYKVFKGRKDVAQVAIITPGGQLGLEMERVTPSLELSVGHAGIFFCQESDIKTNLPDIASSQQYQPHGSVQGFARYHPLTWEVSDAFHTYPNAAGEFYQSLERLTQQSLTLVKRDHPLKRALTVSRATPVIDDFHPNVITAGTQHVLTIEGSGFGADDGGATSAVMFADANNGGAGLIGAPRSEIISWTDTEIQIKVPTRAGTGTFTVVNPDGETGNSPQGLIIEFNHTNLTFGGQRKGIHLYNDNGSGGYSYVYSTSTDHNGVNFDSHPAKASFERALQTWQSQTGLNLSAAGTTTINEPSSADGTNIVSFDQDSALLPAGALGVAYSYYGSCTGTNWFLTGFDVVFRRDGTTGINWNYGPGATPFFCPSGCYDFESVAVHELGHVHQLGHIIAPGNVMHYAIPNGTDLRTLNASSDLNGGNFVMAKSIVSQTCGGGSISPMIRDASASPPLSIGNRVWLDDGADNNPSDSNMGVANNGRIDGDEMGIDEVSVSLYYDGDNDKEYDEVYDIAGYTYTQTTRYGGYYLFDNLPPGTYRVRVNPVNFQSGGVLEGKASSIITESWHEVYQNDEEDNGLDDSQPEVNGIYSDPLQLVLNTEPINETNLASLYPHGNCENDDSNLSCDFGFVDALYDVSLTEYEQNDALVDVGHSHSFWMDFRDALNNSANPAPDGLADLNLWYKWETGSGILEFDNLNCALMVRGTLVHQLNNGDDDPSVKFIVDLNLTQPKNWEGWVDTDGDGTPDVSRDWKAEQSAAQAAEDHTNWGYFDITGTLTAIAPGKAYDGRVFTISRAAGPYAVQLGIGANDKNGNLGLSGWFDLTATGSSGASFTVRGDGNMNVGTASPAAILAPLTLLEGAVNPATGYMNTSLSGSLPGTGNDGQFALPEVINGAESQIVDWVEVYLLDAEDRRVVEHRSALLRHDGGIVNMDGIHPISFSTTSGQYHVRITHRNHLPIETQVPVSLLAGRIQSFNFPEAMKCGDTNQDGMIDGTDRAAGWNQRGTSGYQSADVNLDGTVDEQDLNAIWVNRNLYFQP